MLFIGFILFQLLTWNVIFTLVPTNLVSSLEKVEDRILIFLALWILLIASGFWRGRFFLLRNFGTLFLASLDLA